MKSKSTERGIRKYKSKSDLIFEAYKKPKLSPEKEYLIDKVVRTRGLQGRYGIDHSEQLAIDQELVNKDKDDYLHKLVYKETREGIADANVSKILLERLENNPQANIVTTIRDLPEENVYDSSIYKQKGGSISFIQNQEGELQRIGLSFDEWLKRKEGEKRLKNKLLKEAKLEKRQFYAELAKIEEENKRARVLAMEQWLKDKRLEEAQRIAHLRDIENIEGMENMQRSEEGGKSYKQWLKKQMIKEKQQKREARDIRREMREQERELEAKRHIEASLDPHFN